MLARLAMIANLEGWNVHENEIVGRVSTGAPMASFASGSDENNGEPLMLEMLSTGAQGVAVNWWSGPFGQRW